MGGQIHRLLEVFHWIYYFTTFQIARQTFQQHLNVFKILFEVIWAVIKTFIFAIEIFLRKDSWLIISIIWQQHRSGTMSYVSIVFKFNKNEFNWTNILLYFIPRIRLDPCYTKQKRKLPNTQWQRKILQTL